MDEHVPELSRVNTLSVPDGLNQAQLVLYQKAMKAVSDVLKAGFSVNEIVKMVRTAANIQKVQRSIE